VGDIHGAVGSARRCGPGELVCAATLPDGDVCVLWQWPRSANPWPVNVHALAVAGLAPPAAHWSPSAVRLQAWIDHCRARWPAAPCMDAALARARARIRAARDRWRAQIAAAAAAAAATPVYSP
jgi:hypothetical protein